MTSPFPAPPRLTPSNATTPPNFPAKFRAVALLTPFEGLAPCVAAITYDWSVQAIRFQVFLLNDLSFDIVYTPSGAYVLIGGDLSKPPTACLGPTPTTMVVPSPTWPSQQSMKCPGTAPVQGVNCAWWIGLTSCTNSNSPIYPPPPPNQQVANVFWFRTDTQVPWRWMFINRANSYRLPVLGEVAMAHFTRFESVTETTLPQILSECSTRKQPAPAGLKLDTWDQIAAAMMSPPEGLPKATASLGTVSKLVPGLRQPTANDKLPVWPDRMFLTSFTTPTYDQHFPNQPYPTQVYYDWTSENMLTRMFLPNGMLMDVILDGSSTHIVNRNGDGSFNSCGPTLPVGIPYQDWAGRDPTARILAVLDHNPVLGPNDVIVCFSKPSDSGRVFWAWYTEAGAPVLFMEVPQCCNVQLSLTDYYDWLNSPPAFPPSLFVVPTQCLQQAKA